MFEIDEETQETKFTEEQPPMDTEAMKNLENWSHFWPSILKAGRCTIAEPEGLDEEALAAYMEEQAEKDKAAERWAALSEDTKLGPNDAWLSKVSGDT